jgi:hypothetical protein
MWAPCDAKRKRDKSRQGQIQVAQIRSALTKLSFDSGALICVNASARSLRAACVEQRRTVMSTFTVELLQSDQLRSVFPLIREAVPNLTLSEWLRFARQLTAPRRINQSGIMAARRVGRDYPCGLFCYRVYQDLERGKVLGAEHFVAVDLLDPAAVLTALVAELEGLGQRLGCNAVRSIVHGAQSDVSDGLEAAGHAPEAHLLLKSLPVGAESDRPQSRPTPCRAASGA